MLHMREGVTAHEIEGGWSVPKRYLTAKPPEWMRHPGVIHDWEKRLREEFLSHLRIETHVPETVPPELDLWNRLKGARSASEVQRICRQSQWRSRLTMLNENAAMFRKALRSTRYPRKAQTKDDQRLLYCARVLAGIACRVPFETAIDKLRRLKHPKMTVCKCVECQNTKRDRSAMRGEPCRCAHCSIVNRVKHAQSAKRDKVKE